MWTEENLSELIGTCKKNRVVLIVDHCFAVAGVHSKNEVTNVWKFSDSALLWMAVWDTGKTFGLNEDKLGFIITNNKEIRSVVQNSISILQFGVARRAKLFFSELFRKASYYSHIESLSEICSTNLRFLESVSCKKFKVRAPTAGSLALVDISGTNLHDEAIRKHLIRHKVGVVSGNVFFHGEWVENKYIRIALARRPEYFKEAIVSLLEKLP